MRLSGRVRFLGAQEKHTRDKQLTRWQSEGLRFLLFATLRQKISLLRGGLIDAPPCERGATPNATLIQSLVLFSVFEMSSARIRRHVAITKRQLKVLRLRKRCAYSSQALAIFSRQTNS